MNTINNKRRKESKDKIERIFVNLIQTKEISEITITEICKKAHLNRSTFYANYIDIYDLAEKIKNKLEQDVTDLYEDERTKKYNSNDFTKIFYLVKENPLFFKTYFKLERNFNDNPFYIYDTNLAEKFYNGQNIDYHIEFFKAGFNAVLKKWLDNGCIESPEKIAQIIKDEYKNKH